MSSGALFPAQVHRLVTQVPGRLSLPVVLALCDALDCTSENFIERYAVTGAGRPRKTAGAPDPDAPLPAALKRPGTRNRSTHNCCSADRIVVLGAESKVDPVAA